MFPYIALGQGNRNKVSLLQLSSLLAVSPALVRGKKNVRADALLRKEGEEKVGELVLHALNTVQGA